MSRADRSRPAGHQAAPKAVITPTTAYSLDQATHTDHDDDHHQWSGIFLTDGRVVSRAWLLGRPGAEVSRWRRYRAVRRA